MDRTPRIKAVKVLAHHHLVVVFENDVVKMYDCGQLLSNPLFSLLKEPAFFHGVRVDAGGYGVSWNDDIDLSEYELWTNGRIIGGEALSSITRPGETVPHIIGE